MSNEVQKTTEAALPAYMKGEEDTGADNIDPSDVIIPRIKIVQSTSRAVKKAIKDIKEGSFYNSLNHEVYGETISLFFLLFWKSRIWFDEEFKFIGTQYNDIETKEEIWLGNNIDFCKSNWGKGIDSFNFIVILENDLKKAIKAKEIVLPYFFSCTSASMGPARQVTTQMKTNALKKIPIYAQMYKVSTDLKTFPKGDAHIPKFDLKGRYAAEEEYQYLKELYQKSKELFKKSNTHIDVDTPIADTPDAPSEGSDDDFENENF